MDKGREESQCRVNSWARSCWGQPALPGLLGSNKELWRTGLGLSHLRNEWLEYLPPVPRLLVEGLTPQYFWSSSAYSQKQPSWREREQEHMVHRKQPSCAWDQQELRRYGGPPPRDLRVKDWSQTACLQIWLNVLLLKATLGSAIERALTIPVPLASHFLRGTENLKQSNQSVGHLIELLPTMCWSLTMC